MGKGRKPTGSLRPVCERLGGSAVSWLRLGLSPGLETLGKRKNVPEYQARDGMVTVAAMGERTQPEGREGSRITSYPSRQRTVPILAPEGQHWECILVLGTAGSSGARVFWETVAGEHLSGAAMKCCEGRQKPRLVIVLGAQEGRMG